MATISLCMIVKNEEETIERCLYSIEKAVDEIILIDTGSSDRTKELAAKFTSRIYDFKWINDFSAARNFSYEHATKDYILWLDADDIVLPGDAVKLTRLKTDISPDTDVVMMRYNTGFDERGRAIFSYFRERLTKRKKNFLWREPVHEYLETRGKKIDADINVTHAKPRGRKSDRNLYIYENMLRKGKELSPRGMYYYARELKEHDRFKDAASWFRRFLDSGLGWVEDNILACGELSACLLKEDRRDEALLSMLRGFSYDTPRAEGCCQIGYFYIESEDYRKAAFWFELALSLKQNNDGWSFRCEDYFGYIPSLELAVCYDKLGEYERAAEYNELAARYKPDSLAVSRNRIYLGTRLAESP